VGGLLESTPVTPETVTAQPAEDELLDDEELLEDPEQLFLKVRGG
jgi:hypothetical protein